MSPVLANIALGALCVCLIQIAVLLNSERDRVRRIAAGALGVVLGLIVAGAFVYGFTRL